jgi:hypothetical protein
VRAHHALALLPAAALLAAPYVADRPGRIIGLPVLLAWTVGAVLLTAAVMALIHRLDGDRHDGDPRDGDGT